MDSTVEERKQRFVSIHKNARLSANRSQEYMALELGVSKKTIQNWEKGVSMPDFFQSLEWFRALNINPFAYYMELIDPYKMQELSPANDDEDIDKALRELYPLFSPKTKRALLFLFMGKHGSPAYSVLQLMLCHLHLPIKDRVNDAISVYHKYITEKRLGSIICKDNILPDEKHLECAIEKATTSLYNNESSYNIVE